MTVLDELRQTQPARAKRADHGGSLRAAVDLACLDCCAGSRSAVRDCAIHACPLWPFRPYGETVRPAGKVPTPEEYDALIEARTTDAQRAAREASGERLRAARDKDHVELGGGVL